MRQHLLTAFVILVVSGSVQLLSGQGDSGKAPFLGGLERVEIRRSSSSALDPGDIITFGQGQEGCPAGKKIISFACRIPEQQDGVEFHGGSFNNNELTQMGCGARILRPYAPGEFSYRITLVCANAQ